MLCAALFAVLAAIVLKDASLFDPSYDDIYDEYQAILSEARELAAAGASAAEWADFQKTSEQRLEPIVAELQSLCERRPSVGRALRGHISSDHVTQYIRRPLLNVGRDHLPHAIQAGLAGEHFGNAAAYAQNELQRVRKALDAVSLHSKADGESSAEPQ